MAAAMTIFSAIQQRPFDTAFLTGEALVKSGLEVDRE